MTIIQGLLIFLLILFSYGLIVYILKTKGIFEKYNVSLYGPALLLRTKKGRSFLKKIASRKRFWKAFGTFGVFFCFVMMILMVFVLIFQVWAVAGFSAEERARLPGPEIALVLPGINPILPLEYIGYIILALVVALIVHEFSHGILTLAADLKVKSLGILYFIVPVGAFCEPDEEQLKKTQTIKRMRVYAAGPLANFVVVVITLCLFSFVFMSAVQPVDGNNVMTVYDGTPADEISLSKGSVITSFNDEEIINHEDFEKAINKTKPNQMVNVSYYSAGKTYHKNVELISRYDFYLINLKDKSEEYKLNESFKNESFFGFVPNTNNVSLFLQYLKDPTQDFPLGFLVVYMLPLFGYLDGYNPIVAPFTNSYEIVGPLSVLPDGVFWGFINALYWIFWLNLAVGLFNVLPMIPLDGGFLFNDAIGSIVKKLKKGISDEDRDKTVGRISIVISLIILALVVFPFFAKYF